MGTGILAPPQGFPVAAAAATVVVDAAGNGDATTIAGGIALLPAGGGKVYVEQGTYAEEVSATDKPIVIEGAGDATVISITGAQTAVTQAFARDLILKTLKLSGDSSTSQVGLKITNASGRIILRDVNTENIFKVIEDPVLATYDWTGGDCVLPDVAGTVFANTTSIIHTRFVKARNTANTRGGFGPNAPRLRAEYSDFNLQSDNELNTSRIVLCDFTGQLKLSGPESTVLWTSATTGFNIDGPADRSQIIGGIMLGSPTVNADECSLVGVTCPTIATGLVVNGARNLFSACCFDANGLTNPLRLAGGSNIVDGCHLQGFTTQGIRVQSTDNVISNCRNGTALPLITEEGAANNNDYHGNEGYNASVFIGAGSIVEGGNIRTVTAATTLGERDRTVLGDATGGTFAITLPPAANFKFRAITIKKIDSSANAVDIDGDGAETIDGGTVQGIVVPQQSRTVQSDGTGWHFI